MYEDGSLVKMYVQIHVSNLWRISLDTTLQSVFYSFTFADCTLYEDSEVVFRVDGCFLDAHLTKSVQSFMFVIVRNVAVSLSTRRTSYVVLVRSSLSVDSLSSPSSTQSGAVVQRVRRFSLRSTGRKFKSCSRCRCVTTLGKLFTPMCLCHQAV